LKMRGFVKLLLNALGCWHMDPVVKLACQIREAEAALKTACELNEVAYTPRRAEAIVRVLAEIRILYEKLFQASPTSLAGAGEQIQFASERLPYSHAGYAPGLTQIAARFAAGHSVSADLVWLRMLIRSLRSASCGSARDVAATLLQSAANGVARPVVIHRSARPVRPRVLALPRLDEDRARAMPRNGGGTMSAM
jgi:hypothetical protein